jgi:hypothetical protein
MQRQAPLPQNINNSILQGLRSMPMKDNVSDGSNTFSMFRNIYSRMPINKNKNKNKNENENENGKKKWYGNSSTRDSSQATRQKAIMTYGSNTTNNNNLKSYTTNWVKNDTLQARHRVRSSGSVVPSKCRK